MVRGRKSTANPRQKTKSGTGGQRKVPTLSIRKNPEAQLGSAERPENRRNPQEGQQKVPYSTPMSPKDVNCAQLPQTGLGVTEKKRAQARGEEKGGMKADHDNN